MWLTAVEETIDTILEVVNLKTQGTLKKVVVLGCFVQRYGYKLAKEIPEVDGWVPVRSNAWRRSWRKVRPYLLFQCVSADPSI